MNFNRKPEPKHGAVLAFYAVVWDRHIKKELLIPVSKFDMLKGTIKIP
jgi:hypothetical protein